MTPATMPLTAPLYEYDHGAGRPVTGSYVYRGGAIPMLEGEDAAGELYLCDFFAGVVYRVVVAE